MSTLIESPQPDAGPVLSTGAENTTEPKIEFLPTPAWKRALDVTAALVLLLILLPLFLGLALLIRCVSQGPVFFVQSRVGANGKKFRMWKFRTMTAETDQNEHARYVASLTDSGAPLKKLDIRSRLIPCGSFLRGTGLDELPQLFNVLRGEMSLIGPRPDVLEFEEYQPWQRRRFAVVPGITGLWQVSGKNSLTFDEMVQLDLRYVDQRSLWLDVSILLRTVPVVLRLGSG